jgi:ABC-type transport system substrate-binding protein
MVLGVAACGSGSRTDGGTSVGSSTQADVGKPPAAPAGTLRVALGGPALTMDPTRAVTYYDWPLMSAFFDGLLMRKKDSFEHLSPALATAWRSNDDDTEWTFTLRRGVKFTDGATFNAAAAKKNFEFYMRRGSLLSYTVGPASKITTPDEYTLVLSYREPFPNLQNYVPFVKMISPKALTGLADVVEKRVAKGAPGTGPFIIDSFSARGVTGHANPDYWGDGPHIAKLEIRPIREESVRNAALQAGDVDLVPNVTPRAAQSFESDPRIKLTSVQSWTTETLSLPSQQKPFDDVRVRRALNYAFDREVIAKSILLGHATVTGSVQPPGTYGYCKPKTQYAYDPAKAKELLAQAGLKTPVSVSMVASAEHALAAPIGQALVEQAKAAGFDIKFVQIPEAARLVDLDKPQRKYELHLQETGWPDGGSFHLANGWITDHSNYRGKQLLGLIDRINSTPNGPERERVICDALEEEAKELPEIPLFATTMVDASTASLQNHVPPMDSGSRDWASPYFAK